jgi:hypothetical protein
VTRRRSIHIVKTAIQRFIAKSDRAPIPFVRTANRRKIIAALKTRAQGAGGDPHSIDPAQINLS